MSVQVWLSERNLHETVSLLSTVARNEDCPSGRSSLFFWFVSGFERPLRKHAGGMFLGRGRIHGKSMASRKGVSAAFHLSVHPSAGLCILSTYDTFARNRTDIHSDVCSFYLMMGFEELNATVRWSVVGRAGPRPLLPIPPTGRNWQRIPLSTS